MSSCRATNAKVILGLIELAMRNGVPLREAELLLTAHWMFPLDRWLKTEGDK